MATNKKKAGKSAAAKPRISAVEPKYTPAASAAKVPLAQKSPGDAFSVALPKSTNVFAAAMNPNFMKDLFSATPLASQEKAFSFGREHSANWAASADKTARSVGEAISMSKEQLDAVMESGKIATDLSKSLQESIVGDLKDAFKENVEIAKELLACRTLNEFVTIQNRSLQSNVTRFLNQTAKLTDAWFKLSTEVAEPLSAQASQTAKRVNKTLKD